MTNPPRRFHLQRDTDITGVSGTGRVADGILWPDGTASVRWTGPRPSVVFWDGGIADALHVHGHGGATHIVWDDPKSPTTAEDAHAHQLAGQLRERGNSAMAAADADADGGRTTAADPKYDRAATWYAAADVIDPEAQR
jgi:hypothetical protein